MFVNVYEVSREYGGPEEGGWWFDTGQPVAIFVVPYPSEVGIPNDGSLPALPGIVNLRRACAEGLVELLREHFPRTGKRGSVLGAFRGRAGRQGAGSG